MIYLDNAATTKPLGEVLKTFETVNATNFYNPSSAYSCAFNLYKEISSARKKFINLLGGDEEQDNIIFTSGATESNNIAIFGSVKHKNGTYLFSSGEHPSVYNSAKELYERGYDVQFVPLRSDGQLDYDKLRDMMTKRVCFVSAMFVSNETGAVNDLRRIREIINCKNPRAVFHVDAVQGFGKLALITRNFGVNLCSISAHKIGGVKGVGALYIDKTTRINNINYGGGQEFSLRSGTVNAGGILSFLTASQIAFDSMKANFEKVLSLKKLLVSEISKLNRQGIKIVSNENCSPYIVSIIFENRRGENILRYLDSKGILISNGSACSSGKIGNRILENMGYKKSQVMGAVRVSFCNGNSEDDIKNFVNCVGECLENLDI